MTAWTSHGIDGWRAAVWCVAVASLLTGCWETPSQEWYARPDGGTCDAGCCGTSCCQGSGCDPDAGSRPRERECADGIDNDGDELEDCEDLDCADRASCCGDAGTSLVNEQWSGQDIIWDHLPRVSPTSSPAREVDGEGVNAMTMLTGWDDVVPHALMSPSCLPLAVGAELSFYVQADARDTACENRYDICERHAAVVLSSVRDTLPGEPLLDDLAIRVHGDGRRPNGGGTLIYNQAVLRVTQGGAELGSLLIDPGVRYYVRVWLTPSTRGSEASLRADLELTRADGTAEPRSISVPFVIPQSALVRGASGCTAMGGLHAAVEMVGDRVRLGTVRANALECVNPSQFDPIDTGTTTLTSESLGVPASYGGAHVGAPTLGSAFNSALDDMPRWDLFFEASNQAPELEDVFGSVGHAIAHARSVTFGAQPADWTTSSTPRLGSNPPSCLGTNDTCSEPSVREPFLLQRRGAGDVLGPFTIVFAAASPSGGHTLRVHQDVAYTPSAPLGGTELELVLPANDCTDLRDPALLPVNGGAEGYWLFFTCMLAGDISEIRVARLETDFSPRDTLTRRVITPLSVGPLAAGGVSGAEPIVRSSPEGISLLVWAVARDAEGNTSLVLLTGQLAAEDEDVADGGVTEPPMLNRLPVLVPYLGNPVLRGDDAMLGGCAGLCRITGVAVSDTAGKPEELRFVVARRVVSADDIWSELVPLTQAWRSP